MATLAEIKKYLGARTGGTVTRLTDAPGGRSCSFCGLFGANLMFDYDLESGPKIGVAVCGDFEGCEIREKEKDAMHSRRDEEFKQYVAGLKIPEAK